MFIIRPYFSICLRPCPRITATLQRYLPRDSKVVTRARPIRQFDYHEGVLFECESAETYQLTKFQFAMVFEASRARQVWLWTSHPRVTSGAVSEQDCYLTLPISARTYDDSTLLSIQAFAPKKGMAWVQQPSESCSVVCFACKVC